MVAPVTSVDSPAAEPSTKDETALSDVWGVIVLNDPVNLMSYVTMVLERVLRMSRSKAEEHMMEVHQKGRSLVWKGNREKAEGYVYQLQEWHLNAILERDETD
ncbi:ATP-dependent Clp protease adaptor ClpS [Pelagicoccus sp. NFK12]|jgi:ATP-dependent Clp protease adaptor protein ClpS|uniref:ATP-dependent Clp protease adaptor ClpS n=1 Tax=Pelagicoccus enzymogenes TaxID=2773457 RepID=A0A927FCK1_9BACT|nr:ATP-dependent Clp protease adaptor ClpS [Pelagicoccus enzymogenes]MBD5782633.1 ATP-dependent Clp protease adaptor ClpS [Pelagicoccus enzymogenes]MDQ8199456.1 ATP-dependent Clp protease adaptor ClpS [Pelagicoccus enzymogenes]